MKRSSKRIGVVWLLAACFALMTVFTVLGIGGFVFYRNYQRFLTEAGQLREDDLKSRRQTLKSEVDRTVDFIHYSWSKSEKRLKESVKARTLEAWSIAANLYKEHQGAKNEAEVRKIILDALRPIRFNNGRGYYFATRLDGLEILFADRPEMEGKILIDMQDTLGAYVIRDMIDLVRRQEEGLYEYRWTKPHEAGRDFQKIAYVKYFAPLDAFIGTGEYLDDVERDIQREVLERIEQIRFEQDGYIFVVSYDGVTLMNGAQPDLIGKNLWDMTDPNGVKVIQEERRAVETPDGDFIAYHWEKPSTRQVTPKISFVKGFPQWRWMVGAGFYTDEIDNVIAARRALVWRNVREDSLGLAFIFLTILTAVLLFCYGLSRYLGNQFNIFLRFFRGIEGGDSATMTEEFFIEELHLLAESANRMLDNRVRAEDALRRNEEKLKSIFLAAPTGIGVVVRRVIVEANDRLCEMTGYDREEMLGRNARMLYPSDEDYEWVGREKYRQISEKGTGTVETRWQRKDGRIIHVLLSSTPLAPDDLSQGVTFTALDITERKSAEEERIRLEEQLMQVRRLESIGQLAGGVAHDFNNMLTPILGYAELLRGDLPKDHPHVEDLQQIIRAAERARDLTRQLLAFARKQTLEIRPVDLNAVIRGFESMLRRMIRENVAIEARLSDNVGIVSGDVGQIEQILLNLAVNAQDAMPEGGVLTIETGDVLVDPEHSRRLNGIAPGSYALMTIRDTGTGMDRGTLDRIFDPFFTTKGLGRGTGLGLSTVYGIVKQHQGHIVVQSEPGSGTSFDVYFPRGGIGAAQPAVPENKTG
ncbi:MAG: cache domain-containing protein [Syntrophobacteraceae bacterium]